MKLKSLLALCLLASGIITGCSNSDNLQAQGYIEGKYTYLSASFPGKLLQLNVHRGSSVSAGQLLFTLEAEPENADLQAQRQQAIQAKATIAQIEAALKLGMIDLKRKQALFKKGVIQQAMLDEAQANVDQYKARRQEAAAQLAAAQAIVDKAVWAKTQKSVTAPASGAIFDTYYQAGEMVPTGQPVVSLLVPQNIKAIFYVPQPQLGRLRLAAPITVECDGCAKTIAGRISYISPQVEYTPPVIFSKETRSKLVYRIEAEFNPDIALQLHPGQPVTIRLQ